MLQEDTVYSRLSYPVGRLHVHCRLREDTALVGSVLPESWPVRKKEN
jgi:hypothetical protein